VAARSFCHECDGTGWMLYRSETIDGELEEAYRLCPNRCAPRRCIGFEAGQPCSRPGTMRDGLGYYCEEHIGAIPVYVDADHAHEAIYYLKRWLQIARDRANEFLEMQLSEALSEAEARLGRARGELDQAREDAGNAN
jgi:hypothetical protein